MTDPADASALIPRLGVERPQVRQAITEKEGLTRVNADRLVRLLDQDKDIRRWLPEAKIKRLQAKVRRRAGSRIKVGLFTTPTLLPRLWPARGGRTV